MGSRKGWVEGEWTGSIRRAGWDVESRWGSSCGEGRVVPRVGLGSRATGGGCAVSARPVSIRLITGVK